MNFGDRVQIDHKKYQENGKTIYEYTYEVVQKNGEKVKKVVRRRFTPTKNHKFVLEENRDEVLNLINRYIEENDIKIPSLYKVSNLKPLLKPISTFILQESQIRILLPVLKEFMKKEILLLEK